MPRLQFTIAPVDDEPFVFYTGDLEPAEVGSMFVAVIKRMTGEPPGWSLHVRDLAEPEGDP